MNKFCQLRPMLGYSYFLPKLVSFFSIYDVVFYCFITFTQFSYSFSTGNKHDAALLTDSQDDFFGVLREKYGVMSIICDQKS